MSQKHFDMIYGWDDNDNEDHIMTSTMTHHGYHDDDDYDDYGDDHNHYDNHYDNDH